MRKICTLFLVCVSVFAKGDYWTQKADFPGFGLEYPFSSLGNKGYVGCGRDSAFVHHYDFWEYDPATNAWTQKADFGGIERFGASAFSIGNYGYAGLGLFFATYLQDFWQYDPVNNVWNPVSDFGGGDRGFAVGFSIGSLGYVGTGQNSSGAVNDFWQYDPAIDIWTPKTSLPGISRIDANCFVIDYYGYVVGGHNSVNGFLSDLWQYNSLSDSWLQKANFTSFPRSDAAAFTICDLGYFGTGEYVYDTSYTNDLWQYNPALNAWTQKTSFGGISRDEGAFFSIGSKGYIGLGGKNSDTLYNDFWEYTPDTVCITGIEEIPNNNLQFTISPNPASEFIVCSLQLAVEKKIELTITNVEGKKAYSLQLETGNSKPETKIDVSNFPNGIYFISAEVSKQKAIRKFVKE